MYIVEQVSDLSERLIFRVGEDEKDK